jgi:hypothetical protein
MFTSNPACFLRVSLKQHETGGEEVFYHEALQVKESAFGSDPLMATGNVGRMIQLRAGIASGR